MHSLRSDDPRSIGPFELLGVLGSGGMGRIYLGRIGNVGQAVAVKVIRPDLADDTEFRIRFRREVAAARRVKGKRTAAVLDADVEADHPWLATEFVAGIPLDDAVREHRPLPEESVVQLAAGLLDALTDIHSAGIVHRDLKPSNILLTTDGPVVIDFGIARAADDTVLTATGQFVGSPGYMAPEQIAGSGIQGSSGDIFALGGVLVFAATGRNPFGSGDHVAMLWRVMYEEVDFGDVPVRLHPLLASCLAKDADSRPTLMQLREQLDALTTRDSTSWLPAPIHAAARRRADAFPNGWHPGPPLGPGENPDPEPFSTSSTPSAAEEVVVPNPRSRRVMVASIGVGTLFLSAVTGGFLMFGGGTTKNDGYQPADGPTISATSETAPTTVPVAQPPTTTGRPAVTSTAGSASDSPVVTPPTDDLPDSFVATWSGRDPLTSGSTTVTLHSGDIGDVIGTIRSDGDILGCTVSTLTLVSVSPSQVKAEYRGSSPGCFQGNGGTYATFTLSGDNALSMVYSGEATPVAFVQQLHRTS